MLSTRLQIHDSLLSIQDCKDFFVHEVLHNKSSKLEPMFTQYYSVSNTRENGMLLSLTTFLYTVWKS